MHVNNDDLIDSFFLRLRQVLLEMRSIRFVSQFDWQLQFFADETGKKPTEAEILVNQIKLSATINLLRCILEEEQVKIPLSLAMKLNHKYDRIISKKAEKILSLAPLKFSHTLNLNDFIVDELTLIKGAMLPVHGTIVNVGRENIKSGSYDCVIDIEFENKLTTSFKMRLINGIYYPKESGDITFESDTMETVLAPSVFDIITEVQCKILAYDHQMMALIHKLTTETITQLKDGGLEHYLVNLRITDELLSYPPVKTFLLANNLTVTTQFDIGVYYIINKTGTPQYIKIVPDPSAVLIDDKLPGSAYSNTVVNQVH